MICEFHCVFPDVHIASSCLQKALRRGELSLRWRRRASLLRHDPERLWRRLCVCAFEEFGLVDLGVTARSWRWRRAKLSPGAGRRAGARPSDWPAL